MRRSYAGLDGVRFCAALLVALYHLAYQDGGMRFAAGGWVGVSIFFVISGFVIAFSAERKSAAQFAWHRVMRLYPAAWICATITIIAVPQPAIRYVGSIILSPVGPWVSPVYWTIGVEMSFYALVTACLFLWGSRALVPLGIALGVYSAVAWPLKLLLNLDWLDTQLGYLLLWNHGCQFALGMMLWARRWRLAFAFGVVSLCAVAVSAQGPGSELPWEAPLLWLAAMGLIVASLAWSERLQPHARRARIIGLMTYPLYLLHAELGSVVFDRTGSVAAAVVISVVVAFAVLPVERLVRSALSRIGLRTKDRPQLA
jgi:peptidoglycan/LPS O-acetylase OafA/YrhL